MAPVRCVYGHTGQTKCHAVVPTVVTATMDDPDRMIERHFVQALTGETTVFPNLRIVVLEAHDSLPRGSLGGFFPNRFFDLGEASQVEIDREEFRNATPRWVSACIDEAGDDGHPFGIDDPRLGCPQGSRYLVSRHRTISDREGLRSTMIGVGGTILAATIAPPMLSSNTTVEYSPPFQLLINLLDMEDDLCSMALEEERRSQECGQQEKVHA